MNLKNNQMNNLFDKWKIKLKHQTRENYGIFRQDAVDTASKHTRLYKQVCKSNKSAIIFDNKKGASSSDIFVEKKNRRNKEGRSPDILNDLARKICLKIYV